MSGGITSITTAPSQPEWRKTRDMERSNQESSTLERGLQAHNKRWNKFSAIERVSCPQEEKVLCHGEVFMPTTRGGTSPLPWRGLHAHNNRRNQQDFCAVKRSLHTQNNRRNQNPSAIEVFMPTTRGDKFSAIERSPCPQLQQTTTGGTSSLQWREVFMPTATRGETRIYVQ
ncbi:hypothetical protein ACOMHN_060953 [Nucella lapillus]